MTSNRRHGMRHGSAGSTPRSALGVVTGRRAGYSGARHAPRRFGGLLALMGFTISTLTLPIRLSPDAFASKRAAATPGALTIGCAEASCCSPRCYLDEDGVHHCVPAAGRSCRCGLSSSDKSTRQSTVSDIATLPMLQTVIAEPAGYMLAGGFPEVFVVTYLTPHSPPPRI